MGETEDEEKRELSLAPKSALDALPNAVKKEKKKYYYPFIAECVGLLPRASCIPTLCRNKSCQRRTGTGAQADCPSPSALEYIRNSHCGPTLGV